MEVNHDIYCPCCGYDTFKNEVRIAYGICPICFWEDDPVQLEYPNSQGGANTVSLNEARKNFELFGASERVFLKSVRKPDGNDIRKN